MKVEYKIVNYGTRRSPGKYSIDEYVGGNYLSQAAFYFKNREHAELRLLQMLAEDRAKGLDSFTMERFIYATAKH